MTSVESTDRPSGPGVNQRDLIRLTQAEVDAYLHERHTMSVCTMRGDGTIHAVAMWYGFLDGKIAFETKTKSQKMQNLRRDPRLTCLVESGEHYEELKGVELVGRAEVVEDPDAIFEVGVSVYSRYVGPYSEEVRPMVEVMLNKRSVVTVAVDRVVSWDHAKLGLPPVRG